MKRALIVSAVLALTSCADGPRIDACKHAALRRSIYRTTIAGADVVLSRPDPAPASIRLGREAAAPALAILDIHCPEPR